MMRKFSLSSRVSTLDEKSTIAISRTNSTASLIPKEKSESPSNNEKDTEQTKKQCPKAKNPKSSPSKEAKKDIGKPIPGKWINEMIFGTADMSLDYQKRTYQIVVPAKLAPICIAKSFQKPTLRVFYWHLAKESRCPLISAGARMTAFLRSSFCIGMGDLLILKATGAFKPDPPVTLSDVYICLKRPPTTEALLKNKHALHRFVVYGDRLGQPDLGEHITDILSSIKRYVALIEERKEGCEKHLGPCPGRWSEMKSKRRDVIRAMGAYFVELNYIVEWITSDMCSRNVKDYRRDLRIFTEEWFKAKIPSSSMLLPEVERLERLLLKEEDFWKVHSSVLNETTNNFLLAEVLKLQSKRIRY